MGKKRARVGRALIWLFVIGALLAGVNQYSVHQGQGSWAPQLALDLEGGTQIMLAPLTEEGAQVSTEQLNQAVGIIRQRVNASGISEAEVTTQGGQNIVVSIPGVPDDATRERLQASAQMEFRPVLTVQPAGDGQQSPETELPDDGELLDEDGNPIDLEELLSEDPEGEGTEGEGTEGEEPGSAVMNATDTEPSDEPTDEGETPTGDPESTEEPAEEQEPTDGSDTAWITEELAEEFMAFTCDQVDRSVPLPSDRAVVTCSTDGTMKYILGPVEVWGADISNADVGQASTPQGVPTGEWAVNLEFNSNGTAGFRGVTERITNLEEPRNQFAVVLDNTVLIAPASNAVITNGQAQITGNFSQEGAQTLADQLKFGALPIGFQVQSEETISPRLGESQLQAGLIAGLIGLLLVVVYSLFQYRALGLVTVLSLLIAAALTYLVITFLSSTQGYRLSLAGVTGLMVAIGITADSFIVYFERIRDELRDGKTLINAVDSGWKRALRTIVASDVISLLAAVVLYMLAVGNVQGFAFTLGVTTVIDLVIVALFTHPVVQLLARTKFFGGGHPLSGLDPHALGAVYRGRAKFRQPVESGKQSRSGKEAVRRQTIAERKLAATKERDS
ncbi:protein translocase subunit SecD [uncultured Agrococcus sp.]|uniref:protein translocase subunit SecD n=1 Tax=uncultured Agrococcus sp. TaxID=382258 RepID=UPI0025D620A2|nr:protein translocase subunit SecD [uncultured Agrococcus sp.]